jgi:hypothetical protein
VPSFSTGDKKGSNTDKKSASSSKRSNGPRVQKVQRSNAAAASKAMKSAVVLDVSIADAAANAASASEAKKSAVVLDGDKKGSNAATAASEAMKSAVVLDVLIAPSTSGRGRGIDRAARLQCDREKSPKVNAVNAKAGKNGNKEAPKDAKMDEAHPK